MILDPTGADISGGPPSLMGLMELMGTMDYVYDCGDREDAIIGGAVY